MRLKPADRPTIMILLMFPRTASWIQQWLAVLMLSPLGVSAAGSVTNGIPISFNRHVRPILSEHCYGCHGPDERQRKAGLRLDRAEDAFKKLKSGNCALVPGDLTKSALI